ncbi:PspA/IM30 family protein [Bacillus sp. FJAT-49736]|uniref:PspA/IM30 family protein n=1 Tax=Bacillus sp. FJAT-49736 TaxID=2833582 RepID=UPI001BC9E226|nr:PspA/IM30 family protein [Bacillus sp. FJAT-49736]MBS4172352.1 PspA/IM30 family protein [Bacillus sp. FJAT-49736]
MTNFFERVKNTVMADLHEALDKKEQKNPISLLNQYLRESENETKKVAGLIERQYMLKEEFLREWKQAQYLADKRKKQAEIAKLANEENLLEVALEEEGQYREQANNLQLAYEQAVKNLEELERKHREMKLRLKDMNIKRMELMGRENVMKANQKIHHVLDDSILNGAVTRFEDTERYMEHLEAQMSTGYEKSMFDAKLVQLEKQLKNQEIVVNE